MQNNSNRNTDSNTSNTPEAYNCTVVRYAEIALKGKNRINFENRLVSNLRDAYLKNTNTESSDLKIRRLHSRVIIEAPYQSFMKRVFGISSLSPAISCPNDLESIKEAIKPVLDSITKDTKFRVTGQRINKKYPMSSMELQRVVGAYVVEQTNAGVSLKEFDMDIGIEIVEEKAYIYYEKIPSFGGLPIGSQDGAIALIESQNDVLAALLVMKRGTKLNIINKNNLDLSLINNYAYGYKVKLLTTDLLDKDDLVIVRGRIHIPTQKEYPTSLELDPLIGYTEEDIKTQMEAFENA